MNGHYCSYTFRRRFVLITTRHVFLTTAVCCCFQMVLFYFAGATGGELIAPEDVCSGEAFEVCMGGGTPEIPEDWEGEPAEFCPACIDAWFFGAHLKTTTA